MNTKDTVAIPVQADSVSDVKVKKGYSFYQKLFFLYFLNLTDWLCTEALLGSGKFYEANPFMQPVLGDFWMTIIIKGVLPLTLVLVCALIYKLADTEQSFLTNLVLYSGIIAYACVNLWHIFNFVLLFSVF